MRRIIGTLFLASVATASCSYAIIEPLPKSHRPQEIPHCTGDNWLPTIDTGVSIAAAIGVITTIDDAVESDGPSDSHLANIAVGTATAIAFAWSAFWGVETKRECREARREYSALFSAEARRPIDLKDEGQAPPPPERPLDEFRGAPPPVEEDLLFEEGLPQEEPLEKLGDAGPIDGGKVLVEEGSFHDAGSAPDAGLDASL